MEKHLQKQYDAIMKALNHRLTIIQMVNPAPTAEYLKNDDQWSGLSDALTTIHRFASLPQKNHGK